MPKLKKAVSAAGREEIARLARSIGETTARPVHLMEVCGTHTMAIFRHGLRALLPETVRLISGPGCPVCVTPPNLIDAAIEIARRPKTITATFGDMIRVPGSNSSLQQEKARGADIRITYSALDAVRLAEQNPDRLVCFLGIGFETTSPTVAAAILEAEKKDLANFFVLPAFRLIPPALRALLDDPAVQIDGLICPGHVSVILGTRAYEFIPKTYGVPCVIAGFEAPDILDTTRRLLAQLAAGEARVENQYTRAVKPDGNPAARAVLEKVFSVCDAEWRGLGTIPGSGLTLASAYRRFDAIEQFGLEVGESVPPKGCRCGDVLRGIMIPTECKLFRTKCTPASPVGPCMVSSEGACAAYHKYGSGARGT